MQLKIRWSKATLLGPKGQCGLGVRSDGLKRMLEVVGVRHGIESDLWKSRWGG